MAGAQNVMDVLCFVSGSRGQWELSDEQERTGHIEQVGMAFEIRHVTGSIPARHASKFLFLETGGSGGY